MSTIAEHVRTAMADAGYTSQVDLARDVSIDPTKLSKSLSGSRRFSSLELARIAEACRTTVDALLGDASPTPKVAARTADPEARTEVASQKAIEAAQRFVEYRQNMTGLGYGQAALPTPPSWSGLDWRQGHNLAVWVRETFPDFDPQRRDLASEIEEHFDIDVAVTDLPKDFDGLAWTSDDARLIMANANTVAPGRQRFTLAHELAHVLLADTQLTVEGINSPRTTHSERRASAFAAELLMPTQLLTENAPRTDTGFCSLVFALSVSPDSLAYRLENNSIAPVDQTKRWAKYTVTDAAAATGDTGQLASWISAVRTPRLPQRLLACSWTAYEHGQTTLRTCANLLDADVDDLRQTLTKTAAS